MSLPHPDGRLNAVTRYDLTDPLANAYLVAVSGPHIKVLILLGCHLPSGSRRHHVICRE